MMGLTNRLEAVKPEARALLQVRRFAEDGKGDSGGSNDSITQKLIRRHALRLTFNLLEARDLGRTDFPAA